MYADTPLTMTDVQHRAENLKRSTDDLRRQRAELVDIMDTLRTEMARFDVEGMVREARGFSEIVRGSAAYFR